MRLYTTPVIAVACVELRRTLMRIFIATSLLAFAAACGATSYGASADGSFPLRPPGADYPNWEHMCVMTKQATASETLNSAGTQGWELAAMSPYKGNTLICFKREKPGR